MFSRPPHCPNPACLHHQTPPADFFINRGSYKTKHDRQQVPRYQCKVCKKTFSSRRFSPTYRQHKPQVNETLGNLLSSGVTQRRAAIVMGVNKVTVARKFAWLAERARQAHRTALASGQLNTSYVQFDEMETIEHSKLKPLSIALAVRPKTGEIIGAKVATMNCHCHGHMAALSQKVYGWRPDTRPMACRDVMNDIKTVAKPRITVATDGKTAYAGLIKGAMPHAVHKSYVSRVAVHGARDPLFRLNHTCAKLRADVSRLARRTWSASKCLRGMQDHLDLYIAFNNGYSLN